MDVAALSRPQPGQDLLHSGLQGRGGQLPVVLEVQPRLLDPGIFQGARHVLTLARGVLAVLDQVEHAAHPEALERSHVGEIERVGADQELIVTSANP